MEKITRKQAVDLAIKSMSNAHRWHIADAAHLRQCITALREPVETDAVKEEMLYLIHDALVFFDGDDDGSRELVASRLREFVGRINEPAQTETPRAS